MAVRKKGASRAKEPNLVKLKAELKRVQAGLKKKQETARAAGRKTIDLDIKFIDKLFAHFGLCFSFKIPLNKK